MRRANEPAPLHIAELAPVTFENMQPGELLEQGQQYASRLLREGTKEINANLIVGERDSIHSYMGTLVARDSLLMVAAYGVGKSEMTRHGYKVVDGIDPSRVKRVPARTDLTPTELTGKRQVLKTEKRQDDGTTVTERTSGEVEPILSPTDQIITQDEGNRGNERSNAEMLDITGSHMISLPDGSLAPMTELEMFILAMNPRESMRTTTPLSGARAVRQAWAAILGQKKEWDAIEQSILFDEFEPNPNNIKPVITLEELHIAQAAVKHVILDDTVVKPYIARINRTMVNTINTHEGNPGVVEGLSRPLKQIMHSTRVAALMSGRKEARPEDVNVAVANKMTAMLGGLSMVELNDIEPLVQSVIEQSN
jgi:MoxR-like ATPase